MKIHIFPKILPTWEGQALPLIPSICLLSFCLWIPRKHTKSCGYSISQCKQNFEEGCKVHTFIYRICSHSSWDERRYHIDGQMSVNNLARLDVLVSSSSKMTCCGVIVLIVMFWYADHHWLWFNILLSLGISAFASILSSDKTNLFPGPTSMGCLSMGWKHQMYFHLPLLPWWFWHSFYWLLADVASRLEHLSMRFEIVQCGSVNEGDQLYYSVTYVIATLKNVKPSLNASFDETTAFTTTIYFAITIVEIYHSFLPYEKQVGEFISRKMGCLSFPLKSTPEKIIWL